MMSPLSPLPSLSLWMAAPLPFSSTFFSSSAPQSPPKTLWISPQSIRFIGTRVFLDRRKLPSLSPDLLSASGGSVSRLGSVSSTNLAGAPTETRDYEFCDEETEVELKLNIETLGVQSSNDIFVDVDDTSLLVRVKASGILITLMEANPLFERIKPSETIWYIDEDQLVVNLKKQNKDLKWPDVMESWESLRTGITQLLKGTSIYIIGDSTEINQKIASKLANGIGYTPLSTSEILEKCTQQPIESWIASEEAESIVNTEDAVLESLSGHARTVVATLGGPYGAASKHDKWRHLYGGFSVWLSISEVADEALAKEEVRRHMQEGTLAYTNADVVVKLGGWDEDQIQVIAQACLSALKQLTLSDKQLTGKKSLYVRLGCRGDWPNINPPGWDPSSGIEPEQ